MSTSQHHFLKKNNKKNQNIDKGKKYQKQKKINPIDQQIQDLTYTVSV